MDGLGAGGEQNPERGWCFVKRIREIFLPRHRLSFLKSLVKVLGGSSSFGQAIG